MQEEVNQKTIALTIRGAKVSEQTLKAALRALLRMHRNHRQNKRESGPLVRSGRQSLRALREHGEALEDVVVSDGNIRSFDRFARKYGVDYALKRDKNAEPPRWYVFFRARDSRTMEAAFKEYCAVKVKNQSRPSVRRRLKQAVERTASHRERAREKRRERGKVL